MNNKNSKTTPLAVNIIYEKCANCHYKNGPAPFSLTSYKDIVKRKKMISHVINSDYMPPWPADPNFSNFLGEKTLSEKEKITIQCAVCESAGEIEDEDFSYDYSGFNVDKLQ